MLNTNVILNDLGVLQTLARVAIPVCDTVLSAAPENASELGDNWHCDGWMPYFAGQRPQAAAFRDDKLNLVIVCGGLGQVQDFQLAWEGALRPGQHPKIAGTVNGYALRWAEHLTNWILTLPLQSWDKVYFVGHSFGGPTAQIAAHELESRHHARTISVFTLGAPKWCDAPAARAMSLRPTVRLMNYADPVPYCVPSPDHAPSLFAALSIWEIRVLMQLVHCAGGMAFGSAGQVTPSSYPSGVNLPLEVNPSIMYQLFQNANIPAHAVADYSRRLDALGDVPVARRIPALPISGHPTQPADAGQVEAAVKASEAAIADRHAAAVAVPRQSVASIVRVVRFQKRWSVEVNGKTVYVGVNKSDCFGVARAIRGLARQYLQSPTQWTDVEELAALLRSGFEQGE